MNDRARRTLRWLGWFVPPFFAGLFIIGTTIPGSAMWPWDPHMIDLDVYQRAARDLWAGRDFYATPEGLLPWIYPPFAALLAAPMAIVPIRALQILWLATNVLVLFAILYRVGLRRGWLSLATTLVVLGVEPVRDALGFGQLGIFLVGAAVLDSMPGERLLAQVGVRKRWLPEGWLVGVATAIKLTPAVVAAYNFFSGRRWPGLTAFSTFCAATAVSFALLWGRSVTYWTELAGGNSGINSGIIFKTNQSVMGVWGRTFGELSKGGLLLSAVVALLGLLAAVAVHRAGQRELALCLAGLTSLLASPISWSHHYVWVVPLLAVLMIQRSLPAWLRAFGIVYSSWIVVAPFKSLPGGDRLELAYDLGQRIVVNGGVVLGVVFLLVSLGWGIARSRSLRAAA